jgi:outer membrane protein TolC
MELLSANTAIELYSADKLLRLALGNRRNVRSALYEIELYKNLIELEKQSGGPEFKLGVYRSVNDVKETERGVRLGLSIPIHDFGKRSAAVESLNLKLSGYEFLKEHKSYYLAGVENRILLEVSEKYDTCVFYREKLKRLSGVVLKKASNIFEMARIGYAEGATSLFEYQNAKKNYFEFYESLIQASIDFNISLLELRRACGIAPSDNGDVMEKILSRIETAGGAR